MSECTITRPYRERGIDVDVWRACQLVYKPSDGDASLNSNELKYSDKHVMD
jgi:hypothetical protein